MMSPINLKELYGDRYKISHDPAAEFEPGGKSDPWLYIIPCQYGHVYPQSDKLLAVWVIGSNIRQKIKRKYPNLANPNWSDFAEAIFLFPPEMFDEIAEIVKPKKRRQISRKQEWAFQKFAEKGREHRFKRKITVENGSLETVER